MCRRGPAAVTLAGGVGAGISEPVASRSDDFPSVARRRPRGRVSASVAPKVAETEELRRRSQAAKAADCKSAIPGSNPGGASTQDLSAK